MSWEEFEKIEKEGSGISGDDGGLYAYSRHLEQVCARIVNIGKIVFVGYPFFLMILQNLADLDKTSVLIAWIIGMFALALVLLFVGFFDFSLRERIKETYGNQGGQPGKLKVLQGRAFLKAMKEEHGKARGEKDIDDFTEHLAEYAIEDEDTVLDKINDRVSDFDEDGEESEAKPKENTSKTKKCALKEEINKLRNRKEMKSETENSEDKPELADLDDIVNSTLMGMSVPAAVATDESASSKSKTTDKLPITEEPQKRKNSEMEAVETAKESVPIQNEEISEETPNAEKQEKTEPENIDDLLDLFGEEAMAPTPKDVAKKETEDAQSVWRLFSEEQSSNPEPKTTVTEENPGIHPVESVHIPFELEEEKTEKRLDEEEIDKKLKDLFKDI